LALVAAAAPCLCDDAVPARAGVTAMGVSPASTCIRLPLSTRSPRRDCAAAQTTRSAVGPTCYHRAPSSRRQAAPQTADCLTATAAKRRGARAAAAGGGSGRGHGIVATDSLCDGPLSLRPLSSRLQRPISARCAKMPGRRIQWQPRTVLPPNGTVAAAVGPSGGPAAPGTARRRDHDQDDDAPFGRARLPRPRPPPPSSFGGGGPIVWASTLLFLHRPPTVSFPTPCTLAARRRSLAAAAPCTPRRRWHVPSRRRGGHH